MIKASYSNKKSRHISQQMMWINLLKALDILLVSVPFSVSWYCYYAKENMFSFSIAGNLLFVFSYLALLTYLIDKVFEGFRAFVGRLSELVCSQILGTILTDLLFYGMICVFSKKIMTVIPGLLCCFIQIILIILGSLCIQRVRVFLVPPQRTMIIYGQSKRQKTSSIQDELQGIREKRSIQNEIEGLLKAFALEQSFEICAIISAEECVNNLSILQPCQSLFLKNVSLQDQDILLNYCAEKQMVVYLIPRVRDFLMKGSVPSHFFHLPVFQIRGYDPPFLYRFGKRLMDLVISSLAIILTWPVFLITAVMIKGDGGPVFYKQDRLTKGGRVFQILKFRSMKVEAEKDGIARLSAGKQDDRITKVGRLIRAVRIDELPQLLNIIKGDMSLVGPRPERPSIAREYEKELPEFKLRLQTKAGLTGYAQIYGKYSTTPEHKLLFDLIYISHPSIREDFRLLLATLKVLVMFDESTEGVTVGQTTANHTEKQKMILQPFYEALIYGAMSKHNNYMFLERWEQTNSELSYHDDVIQRLMRYWYWDTFSRNNKTKIKE